MPVNLSIKRVPEELVERLRARARRNHRSLQGELMAVIQTVADAEPGGPSAVQEAAQPWGAPHARSRARSLDAGRERVVAGPGESTIIIRQTRDAREFRIEDLQEYLEKLPFETPAESATWIRRDRDRR